MIALWSSPEGKALLHSTTRDPGGAFFPDPKAPRPASARVTAHAPGAKALAVAGTRVALFGGYGPETSRLCVGTLDDDRLIVTGKYRITLPDGTPIHQLAALLRQAGDQLYRAG